MADEKELNLETMPLEELKAAALAEEAKEQESKATPDKVTETNHVPPGQDSKSVADVELPKEEAEEEPEQPEQFVYKKEIDLGDGSGVQVFRGTGATALEALEELTEKLAEAQRHATKKIHELNTRVKSEDTRTAQQKTDDEYVIAQRLQKEPSRAIRDVVTEVIAEREAANKRNFDAQQAFVDSHPDYLADPKNGNGNRMLSEYMRLNPGATEFTEEGLEKAYQSLKDSGLLKLRIEEAGGTTEEETKEPQRIVEAKVETTQPRSPKRASTVSTRGGGAPVLKTGPTEDELYSMPLDKLKQLSNEQLAKAAQE